MEREAGSHLDAVREEHIPRLGKVALNSKYIEVNVSVLLEYETTRPESD